MSSTGVIRIDPAGCSYKDWEVSRIPRQDLALFQTDRDQLSTFYRSPKSRQVNWVRRVSVNPRIRFTARLFR